MYYWAIIPMLIVLAYIWRCRRYVLFHAMECGLYTWGMRWVVPRIRFTWYHAKLPDWKYQAGYKFLEPDDKVLTVSKCQLTSMCIPGDWTHAALCVGRDDLGDAYEMGEMRADGYNKSSFEDVCRASRVVILRCDDWDKVYIAKVIAVCKTFEDCLYDPRFMLGLIALYCSELFWHSDFEKRVKVDTSDLMGLGRPYVSPQDYYDAKNVRVIWDSADEHIAGAA